MKTISTARGTVVLDKDMQVGNSWIQQYIDIEFPAHTNGEYGLNHKSHKM